MRNDIKRVKFFQAKVDTGYYLKLKVHTKLDQNINIKRGPVADGL